VIDAVGCVVVHDKFSCFYEQESKQIDWNYDTRQKKEENQKYEEKA
jgi:hypothetical protein